MIDNQKFRDTLQTATNFLVAFIIALLIAFMINNVNVTAAHSESVDAPIISADPVTTPAAPDKNIAPDNNIENDIGKEDGDNTENNVDVKADGKFSEPASDTSDADSVMAETESSASSSASITEKEIIRCGYTPWAPAFIVDPESKEMSGYAHDIIQKIADDLGWSIEWIAHPAGTSPEDQIKAGLYDVLCSGSCSAIGKLDDGGLIYTSDDISMSQTYMETALYEYPATENVDDKHSYDLSTMGTRLIDKIKEKDSTSFIDNGYNINTEDFTNRKDFTYCKNAFALSASDMKLKFIIDNLLHNMGKDGTLEQIARRYMDKDTNWRIKKYMAYIDTGSLNGMLRGPASGNSECSFIEDLKSVEKLTQPKEPDEKSM